MASSSSSTPLPHPRNKYHVFISFIGEDTSNCLNDQLSAHTSIFCLQLLVVLGICVGAAIVIVLFLIFLWFTKRNNNSSNHNSSHNPSIPNVSKEIQQIKLDPSRDMASSTSSATSSQSPKKYDVFISFRGEDTRLNFTSHLHAALRSKQIDTYIDYRLDKGDDVWPSLEKAIEDSILFLVIFSENYASSTWCLKELGKILECSKNEGHLLIPVFYRVDPSHVRKQSGSYQKAFEEHKRKSINKQQLQKWREALTDAANLSGWDCGFHRDEAELIKEMVNFVIQRLGRMHQSNDYLKGLIGIQKRMTDLELLLDKSSSNVQFIGIWGMGGIGKTTLAKVLFHKLRFAYEGSCFMAHVREKSRKNGIDALREKLILKLLGDTNSLNGMLDSVSPFAMNRLGRKKVFIVLDDVDDHEQLENLARRHEFGSGSKILITTRDKQVLGKEVDDIYQLKALNPHEAFNLFSINAFRNDLADPKVKELAEKVTQYANGNPLALKVLGSFLYGKDQEEWKSQLGKLQKSPFLKINDILELSLQGLDDEEKNIFLYIACFFSYYDVQEVNNLLDACGYSTKIGLKRLEDKSLLDIQGRRVCMHHLIKKMGIRIVREESLKDPKSCNILWISKKNSEILKKNTGSEAVEGIILNLSEVDEMCISSEAFCSMPNLKFLCVYENLNPQVGNELKFPCGIEFLPNKLKLLCWMGYPSKSLPATFKAENLVQIQMRNSNLTKLWDGDQNLVNLTKIDLSGSKDLIELPNFSTAIHLEKVYLSSCSKLRSVHPSILSLHSLHYLLLGDCKALTSLISNTRLKSLSYLSLYGCSRLKKFSVTSENLSYLNISGTTINDELCSSSGRLSKIDSLSLHRCKSVTSLNSLVDLHTLTHVNANCCNKLTSNLHSLFNEIRTLKVLDLSDCNELFEVPKNISFLSSLRDLSLSRTNIETLPLSIKYLSSLQELWLEECKRLRFLPELPPYISNLSVVDCLSLETLHLSHIHNYEVPKVNFMFTNCMKLDGQSIKAVETKVLLGINIAIYEDIRMEYPGERVPEWFMYSTTQRLVDVDLRSIPEPWDGSFIFCVVISKSEGREVIHVNCLIDGQNAGEAGRNVLSEFIFSDHIFLWYDQDYSCGEVQRKIEEKKRDAENNSTYHPLLQIQFTVGYPTENVVDIKECGVCPTSALECQNYIQQIQLASNSHPNSIAIMEERPRKHKFHTILR